MTLLAWLTLTAGLLAGLVTGFWVAARFAARRSTPGPMLPDLQHFTAPLNQVLGQVRTDLMNAERARAQAHGELAEQVRSMRAASDLLRAEAGQLVDAFRAPQVRGRWGETQLRRLVESAGMLEHVDFVEQQSFARDLEGTGAGGKVRPDLVVRLAGGKNIVVDSKVSFQGYLDAMSARNEAERAEQLARHSRHLRQHVRQLADAEYWNFVDATPEFVVMFVPAESFVITALDTDPGLWDFAFESNVIIATPATLLALLRTVAHTWRQEKLTDHAQQVLTTGKELHRRLGTVGGHLTNLSKRLNSTVEAFNTLNASLDSRLAPMARRFSELQDLPEVELTGQALHVAALAVTRSDFFPPDAEAGNAS